MTKVTNETDAATAARILAMLNGGAAPQPQPQPQPATPAPIAPAAPAVQPVAPAPVAPVAPVAQAPQVIAPGAPIPPTVPAAAPVAPAAPVAGAIQQTQVSKAAQDYARTYGPAAAKQVLGQFGITKVGDAKPEQYAAIIAALALPTA